MVIYKLLDIFIFKSFFSKKKSVFKVKNLKFNKKKKKKHEKNSIIQDQKFII